MSCSLTKLSRLISRRSLRCLSTIPSRALIPNPPLRRCPPFHNAPARPHSTRPGSGPDRPPTEMAPLFPGCDYRHWLIVMDKPGGEGASKEEMIRCYVQTLAKLLGSEEEARVKIYNVSCDRYFGFGCELEEEMANKMEDFPGVLFVLPDSYVDAENQDYGAELFVNGEIVQRSPERQRRVEPQPQRERQRPSSPRPRRRM